MGVRSGLGCLCAVLVLCVCVNVSQGMFVMPSRVPVDRLLGNASAYVKENPENPHGYYVLGRIHYLAFANKSSKAPAYKQGKGSPPEIAGNWRGEYYWSMERSEHALKLALEELGYLSASEVPPAKKKRFGDLYRRKVKELTDQRWQPVKISEPELFQHAGKAVANFRKAIELDQKKGLYHLGLASILEQYVDYLREVKLQAVPEEFRRIILRRATDVYYRAYELSIRADLKHKSRPVHGLSSLVGYEAGGGYVRLIEGAGPIGGAEKSRLSRVRKSLKRLDGLPMDWITPILFSLEENHSAQELLKDGLQVRFDLDGDGAEELRSWVAPTTGILVWDPDGRGEIRSGRQMFGSVTWWLFFADGYQALDALDDNRDRQLSSSELAGIYVWFDRDSNGKSEPAEMRSLKQLQIVSIATRSSGIENGWPANEHGLTLKDGRTVATYDWIAPPVEKHSQVVGAWRD